MISPGISHGENPSFLVFQPFPTNRKRFLLKAAPGRGQGVIGLSDHESTSLLFPRRLEWDRFLPSGTALAHPGRHASCNYLQYAVSVQTMQLAESKLCQGEPHASSTDCLLVSW
jgi:hypothetical protein